MISLCTRAYRAISRAVQGCGLRVADGSRGRSPWEILESRLLLTNVYVDSAAPGSNQDGSSWANAYASLQAALGVAVAGDRILVADGIYKPTATTNRRFSFQLKTGISLEGGYAGASGPAAARDIVLYPTVLSGDIGTVGDNTDNSYHVVDGSGTDSTAVLDGFTIAAGNAHGDSDSGQAGGGVYNFSGSPTLTNCTLIGNTGLNGGGMFNYSSSATLTRCTFSGGTAFYGGGICNYSSTLTLSNCTFSGNMGVDGGAMFNYSSSGMLTNCAFSGNSGSNGGGMYINSGSSPVLVNCTFSGNTADVQGGAIFNQASSPSLANCILWGNGTSPIGSDDTSTPEIIHSDIQGGYAGAGNIDADPLFVRNPSPGGDGTWGTADDDYGDLRLDTGSPCIDTGSNVAISEGVATDLAGNPRISDGMVDMGTYEDAGAPAWSGQINLDLHAVYVGNNPQPMEYLAEIEVVDSGSADSVRLRTPAGHWISLRPVASPWNNWGIDHTFANLDAFNAEFGDGPALLEVHSLATGTQTVAFSTYQPGTTTALPWPSQSPVLVSPLHAQSNVPTNATISWQSLAGAGSELVFLYLNDAADNVIVSQSFAPSQTSYGPVSLAAGTWYDLSLESANSFSVADGTSLNLTVHKKFDLEAVFGTSGVSTAPVDLAVSGVTADSQTLVAGDTIVATVTGNNIGAGAALATDGSVDSPVLVSFVLSRNRILGDSDDIPLGSRPREGFLPEPQAAETVDWYQVPVSATTGDYYLAVSFDSANVVPESNESNNIAWTTTPSIHIQANQAPSVSTLSRSLAANTSLAFTAVDFTGAFSDPDSGDSLQKVKITTLPAHGTLKLNSMAVTQGQEITVGQLGTLTYTPASGYAGLDSFGWNGSDGSLYAASAASVNLTTQAAIAQASIFGSTSGDFSGVPFIHAKPGKGAKYVGFADSAGQTGQFTYSLETMLGIKVLHFSGPWDLWLAKDKLGGVWMLKGVKKSFPGDIHTPFQANTLAQAIRLTDAPDIDERVLGLLCSGGGTVGATVQVARESATVVSMSATLSAFPGYQFVKVRVVYFASDEPNYPNDPYDAFYHPSVGMIRSEEDGSDGQGHEGMQISGWLRAPTDVKLSPATIAEHQASGTVVGILSATDSNIGDTFTYSLVSGTGSTNNASFTISDNQLKTNASFNYETKKAYSIRVRARDNGGLYFDKAIAISVTNVNEAPTGVKVSPGTVAEHKPAGTTVGTLSATDLDAGTTFTYTLVDGSGTPLAADNAAFKIIRTGTGSQLQTNTRLDYETRKTYSLIIRAKDQGGLFCDKPITIGVSNVNETPTGIAVTPATALENKPAGTAVGMLSTTDPDIGDRFTYTLVSGTGSTDNAAFKIMGNQLRTTRVFNYETKASYAIRVRSKDQGGMFCEKALVIGVGDANEPPTGLNLTTPGAPTPRVMENAPAGAVVGTFSAIDPDAGSTFTYSLIDGTGSADNGKFAISDNQLLVGVDPLAYTSGQTYHILVRVTDQGGLSYNKAFALAVVM